MARTTEGQRGGGGKGQQFMTSPLSGSTIPTGAHPANTGGKAGRSGRPPGALREAMREVLDTGGVDLLRAVISGAAEVTLNGRCEHCGKLSSGPVASDDLLAATPTIDNRLRAVDTAAKYGLGERSEYSEDVVAANIDRMMQAAELVMTSRDFKRFAEQVSTIWNGE